MTSIIHDVWHELFVCQIIELLLLQQLEPERSRAAGLCANNAEPIEFRESAVGKWRARAQSDAHLAFEAQH